MTDITPIPFDLSAFQVTRPEKVAWIFPAGVTPLDGIKSKSLRKFLTHAEEHLHENHVSWSLEPLSADGFSHWLKYYRSQMFENGFRIIADDAWYAAKIAAGWQVMGLLFYQDGDMVASGIIGVDQKTKTCHLHFKANHKIELSNRENSSIGAVVDYFFLKYAFDQKFTTITGGKSRNAFGLYNTIGYLDFKLKFGFLPEADLTSPTSSEVPTLPDKRVVFYGLKDKQLQLFEYSPSSSAPDIRHQLSQVHELISLT